VPVTLEAKPANSHTTKVGHHVQNQLGILPKVQQAKEGMEQADAIV
jgi:predicted metalloprotease